MNKIYAFHLKDENIKGIVETWPQCKEITKGKNATYKAFKNKNEAQQWLDAGATYNNKLKTDEVYFLEKGIYFDAGKRGKTSSTYVRITDETGKDLYEEFSKDLTITSSTELSKVINKINGKNSLSIYKGKKVINLGLKATNNLGELVGFITACIIAINRIESLKIPGNTIKIFGDSSLVLDYWSKGNYNKTLVETTKSVINIAVELRLKLEKLGVTFKKISGDINPADLGDHK